MENSYYQFTHQLSRTEKSKHFDAIFKNDIEDDPRFHAEDFLNVYYEMRDKFQVSAKLFGEANFKILIFEYLRLNPKHNRINYGEGFPDFIGNISALQQMRFIKWIAKLDWFWFADDKEAIQLPKGTLRSWGNLQRDEDQIEIAIDESIMESLAVEKVGNEYKIVAK